MTNPFHQVEPAVVMAAHRRHDADCKTLHVTGPRHHCPPYLKAVELLMEASKS